MMPDSGTYCGFYHRNRAGVGRFAGHLVPERLNAQFAPYDGQFIEVEIAKLQQRFNPGIATVEEVKSIKPLPPFALQLGKVELRPSQVTPGTFDLFYSLKNAGQQQNGFETRDLQVALWTDQPTQQPDEVESFHGSGYTRGQLAFGASAVHTGVSIFPGLPGTSSEADFDSHVVLQPGDSAFFVWHSLALAAGRYEMALSVATYGWNGPTLEGWHSFEVPASGGARLAAPPAPTIKANSQSRCDDEWLWIEASFGDLRGAPIALFQGRRGPRGTWKAFDANGQPCEAEFEFPDARGDSQGSFFRVPGSQRRTRLRVRRADKFAPSPLKRVELAMMTESGLESVTVADNLAAPPPFALPPWGNAVGGVSARVRPAKLRFERAEERRFFFQAKSDFSTADAFQIVADESAPQNNAKNWAAHLRLEVDGQPLATLSGIYDEIFYRFPFQSEFVFSDSVPLAPGKHKFRVVLKGDGNLYRDLADKSFRRFQGTLVSNEVEFGIAP